MSGMPTYGSSVRLLPLRLAVGNLVMSSSHRRTRAQRTKLRRGFTAAVLAVTAGAGTLLTAGPALAAGPWFVAPTGTNNSGCGLASGSPCNTVTYVLAKAAFVDGDTINVAAGTYADKPLFGAKTANVLGAGAGTIFDGTASSYAMAVNITNGKTLKLSNLTLTKGKFANGGGLSIASGQVIATNVNVTNSTGSATSGGVYVPAGGSLSMTGGTLSGNTGAVGGALFSIGTVTTNGTTISGNSSPFGGALAMSGTATITNSTVSGNTSTNQGGAFFNNTGVLTLTGTSVSGGSAVSGGAFYQQAGTTLVNGGSTVSGNTATNGAGFYNLAGTTTVTNSAVTSNTASNQGGGIYSANGGIVTNGAVVNNNSAGAVGGGASIVAGTASFNLGTISGNSAANGGGFYTGGTTTVDGTTLTGNAANGGTTSNGGNAGAIYNSAALTVKNATFNGNKAVANTNAAPGITGYGGAVASFSLAASGAPTLSFTATTINGDNAGTPVSGGNAVIGGAIAALGNVGAGGANTVTTASGLTLSKNVALAGGGIYTTGTTTLNGSTLDRNKATHPSVGIGGGLYAATSGAAPTITLDDTDVTGNDGAAGGGGIVTGASVNTVVRNGSNVTGNSGAIGGGIYAGSALTVQGSHVDNNQAGNSGAGIYSLAPITLTNSSVDGNSAAFLGGGIAAAAPVTMTGGTVSGNDAYGAGGLFLGNDVVGSFDDTDFTDNTSTGANFGGGAVLSAGKLTINNAQITGNKADGASGLGGALFSGTDDENVTTTLKLTNSTLSDNEAFSAAAIYAGSDKATSTNKTSISNVTIHQNASSGPFGAVEVLDPTSITGSTITDNTAVPTSPYDAYGGILSAGAGQVSLSGSVLSGNSGHQCNYAVADGGYNLNSPTATDCAFSTTKGNTFAAPQLGSLANNGGPTTTRLPSPTSPALNKIPAATATGVTDAITGANVTLCATGATDQRGTARPQGAKCDVGAVEADQVVPVVSGPSAATYSVGIAGAPQTFTSTGSPQPTLSATGLPAGVTFVDNGDGTGTLAGTPGANTGGIHTISVKATNEAGADTKTFTLTITQAPALAGPGAATYTVGQPGGPTTFTSTGQPTSTLSSSGTLPSGVGFADNGDGTGAYSGTPAASTGGLYNLTVKGANGTPPDASLPFALTVKEAPSLAGPGSATFKVGTAGQSTDFTATGFPAPALSASGLPAGLGLGNTSVIQSPARISGTPANGTGGVYPVTVTASNGVGSPATKNLSVTVNEAPELTGPSEARFVTGSANAIGYSSDGFPQATLTQTGTLPAGLSFVDNGNGSATISGTAPANAVGDYPITITASNGQSPDAVTHTVITVAPPLAISSTILAGASFRTAYSAQVMATGGQPGYSFQVVSGALPGGLTMSSFGLITGSPTVSAGTFTFTVKATDSADPAQTATKVLAITVAKGDTQLDVTPILLGFKANGDISLNLGLVEADLTGGDPLQPIAGATVVFKSGTRTVCTGVTNAAGHAQCSQNPIDALLTPLKGTLTASYAGNATWNPSSGSAPLIK